MDNQTQDEPTDGGVEWELSEAIRLMGEAQVSGDPVLIATAMRRHAEALSNQSIQKVVPTLRHVLETVLRTENKKLATAIENHIAVQDGRFDYILGELNAQFEKDNARYDFFAGEFAAITTGIGGLKAGQERLQSEFQQIGESVDGLRIEINELSNAMESLEMRSSKLEIDVRTLSGVYDQLQLEHARLQVRMQDVISRFEHVENQFSDLLAKIEQEQADRQQESALIREETIMNEITAAERRQIVDISRWLRDNKHRFVLHDPIPTDNAVVCINDQHVITQASMAFLHLFGYAEWELIGKSLDILIPDLPTGHHGALVHAFGETGIANRVMSERTPVQARHKSGELMEIRATIGHDESGYTAIVERVSHA